MSGSLLLRFPPVPVLPPSYEELMDEIRKASQQEVAVLEQIRDVNTAMLTQLTVNDKDKETRLRRLERLSYIAVGAIGVLSLAVQLLFQLWMAKH